MTGYTVAEIDGPRQARRKAVGVVGGAGEKASDAADGDTQAKRHGKKVAGAGAYAAQAFDQLDPQSSRRADRPPPSCHQAAESVRQVNWSRGACSSSARMRLPKSAPMAPRGQQQPALLIIENVAAAVAASPVEGIAERIAEHLKDWVKPRMGAKIHARPVYRSAAMPVFIEFWGPRLTSRQPPSMLERAPG